MSKRLLKSLVDEGLVDGWDERGARAHARHFLDLRKTENYLLGEWHLVGASGDGRVES